MKKVVATLIIKDKEIINLSVNDNKGHLTTLTPALTHFNNVKELYNCVLKVLKNNGFYTHLYREFGMLCHNIQVIDLNNPSAALIYGIFDENL